jgi:signal transduction histidine kinase
MPAQEPTDAETSDERLALLDELGRAERRALGFELASAIAHMIGTPLHVIAGRASLIRGGPEDASVADNARRIEEQVERLAERMRAFIDYLTFPESAPAAEPTAEVLEKALSLCAPAAKARGVSFELETRAPSGSVVAGSSTLLVLTRLLTFSARVAPKGSVCSLSVEVTQEGRLAFSLSVPGLEPRPGRLESLEPPAGPQSLPREEHLLLASSAAIARRKGGSVEVVAGTGSRSTIRFVTPRTG